jgi:hypothetical protein
MVSPEAALKILVENKFSPVKHGEQKLTIPNFNELTQLSLSPGSEVELEGYITYASRMRGRDADIHFNLSPQPNDDKNFIVCEIQNAENDAHGKPLKKAWENQEKVKVTGVLRIFLEHVYETTNQPHLPHIFEIHPLSKVVIGEDDATPDITMDSPDHANFRDNESMHRIELQDDGSMIKDSTKINDDLQVKYDDNSLTILNPPHFNVNYVYTSAYFSRIHNGPFPEGRPYIFELKRTPTAESVGVKSVAIPGTPGYYKAKEFHDNPPNGVLTAAMLRSLNIPELMNSNYEIIFCPVYRLE